MEKFNFKKKFGQNFLSDKNLLGAIAKDAEIGEDDEVLEIGAGAGSLTQILSQRAKKVVAYEIDTDLKDILVDLNLPNVKFVFEDFMKTDMKNLQKNFSKKVKVVANLPYYITTPIIFKLFEQAEFLDSLTVMVQKEVAERVCALPNCKDYGVLTVMTQFYGTPKITRIVGRGMFQPMPNVDSAVLNIKIEKKFPQIDNINFSEFVKTCFSMRRKTLLNNLLTKYPKQQLQSLFTEEILRRRAETFSLQEFVDIFMKLSQR